jgi:hypothetical protein
MDRGQRHRPVAMLRLPFLEAVDCHKRRPQQGRARYHHEKRYCSCSCHCHPPRKRRKRAAYSLPMCPRRGRGLVRKTVRAEARPPSCSAKMGRGGLQRTSPLMRVLPVNRATTSLVHGLVSSVPHPSSKARPLASTDLRAMPGAHPPPSSDRSSDVPAHARS